MRKKSSGKLSSGSSDTDTIKLDKPLTSDEQLEAALNSIPENEAAILRSQLEIPKEKASLLSLYRYCKPVDVFLLVVAFISAVIEGVALPMFALVVGAITNNFTGFKTGATNPDDFQSTVNHNALYYVYIGIVIMVAGSLESFIFCNRGEVLAARYRKNYLRAVLNQNIAYFDRLGTGSVSTRITNSTTSIQEAISEKCGTIIKSIACFIAALVIALASQWKLALIVLSVVIYLILGVGYTSGIFVKNYGKSEATYAKGSNIADEAFSAARNTIALGAQGKMIDRYNSYLETARKQQHLGNIYLSIMLGILWSSVGFIYALAFWEGSRLLAWGEADVGKIIVVFMSLTVGAFQLSGIAPQIRFIIAGISGAKTINSTIDRVPVIDAQSDKGKTIENLQGHISFENVRFRYPSRPSVLVLPDFSLEVLPGQTVALVGASGSGKSTVVGLVERFYLYLGGSIKLDGVEISDLNVRWLRQQIGLVSQEPVLFANSIAENVQQGLIGTQYEHADPEKKRELVIEACKQANAWDFIQTLGDGLDTNVGDRGFLLSGGQKQRIAIARAIVSNPKILLLDEATSALDTKSEGIVQEALDRAAKSRTTIVVAHRLSTIRDADKIVVMSAGEIVEQGTHNELLEQHGAYSKLVEMQKIKSQEAHIEDEEDKLVIKEDDLVEEDDFDQETCRIPGITPVKVSLRKVVGLLWDLNKNEHTLIWISFVLAIFVGYAQDGYAMLLGKSSESMMVQPDEYPEMRKTINLTSGMFFMIGMHQLIVGFVFVLLLTTSGEHLLQNVRLTLFKQFLRMDISFFDFDKNTPGALTAILAKDGKAIEGLGGATFGQILQCLVILIGGIITGIAFNWRLGLVGLACVPVIVGCGYGRLKILTVLEERTRKTYEKSAGMASSYTSAVRTVQFLTREDDVCDAYGDVVDAQVKASIKSIAMSAVTSGMTQGLIPWVFALIWWYGSKLLREGKCTVFQYYVVFIGLILGAQAAGQAFSFAPDVTKAKSSSANVLKMVEAKPIIDYWSTDGIQIDQTRLKGELEFKNIYFRYPTRPTVPVLRDISLRVEPGQYVALVGASGSGKSTLIGLCERFYDPTKGQVLLDGIDLKDYNVNSLRSCLGLVQQEPMLYSGTIQENVLFGTTEDVPQERIEQACRQANIHEFIMSLPDGYATDVGAAGGLLSGGQKQRIAIARVIVRNPSILLLDEATSALDAESEKTVQSALDNVMKGRTILSVAHRLSTIQNADMIYVFDKGHIVEKGTHTELVDQGGRYAELVRLQSLENV